MISRCATAYARTSIFGDGYRLLITTGRTRAMRSVVHRSPLVRAAFIPVKNWPCKRVVLTSMHFTLTDPLIWDFLYPRNFVLTSRIILTSMVLICGLWSNCLLIENRIRRKKRKDDQKTITVDRARICAVCGYPLLIIKDRAMRALRLPLFITKTPCLIQSTPVWNHPHFHLQPYICVSMFVEHC